MAGVKRVSEHLHLSQTFFSWTFFGPNIYLGKSNAYFSFMVVMLQILQSNCNNNDLIYEFGIKDSMPGDFFWS